METPDYCEGCNQRFAPIDQQSCWGCKDGDLNSSKRGQRMTKTMEKRHEQMDAGVIVLCETISQVKKSLCGNEKATNDELLQAVSQLKSRLAQVEKERDAMKHDFMIDGCEACKHGHSALDDCNAPWSPCKWEWRGICSENAKESSE